MNKIIDRLFDTFEAHGAELWLVGGAVRDLYMGESIDDIKDYDFATNLRPPAIVEIFAEEKLPIFAMGERFGTIGTLIDGYDVQITTYRSGETYDINSRHPEVTFGTTVDEDLVRRDFTMNTMAWTPNIGFYDPFYGMADITDKVLRVPSAAPHAAFTDDPLRMMRMCRFASKYGFTPITSVMDAALELSHTINDVAPERVMVEMNKLLLGDNVEWGLQTMRESGILFQLLPEVNKMVGLENIIPVVTKDLWQHVKEVVAQTPKTLGLRWAGLIHDIGKPVVWNVEGDKATFYGHEEKSAELFAEIRKRFKFPNVLGDEVEFISRHHGRMNSYSDNWTDSAVRRLCKTFGDYTPQMIDFAKADITTAYSEKRDRYEFLVEHFRNRVVLLEAENKLKPDLPAGIGKDIMVAFDLEPGPQVGILKGDIETAILDGLIDNGQFSEYYVNFLLGQSAV